jgi:hypothetical protein
MGDFPDSPEAVALALLREILDRENGENPERPERRNRRAREEVLDLYAECLMAARGDRSRGARVLQ